MALITSAKTVAFPLMGNRVLKSSFHLLRCIILYPYSKSPGQFNQFCGYAFCLHVPKMHGANLTLKD